MHYPPELYQIEAQITARFPDLRPAQQRGLALWLLGVLWAHSISESAVIAALLLCGRAQTIRQRLREWLWDGADKAAPCTTQVDVAACFQPLMRWLVSWWQARDLALAVDATLHGTRVTALVVSVLYRGSAIPVAWAILPANKPGAWIGPFLRLLRLLRPAIPAEWTVLVLADRGLRSPRLWKRIRDLGWHPVIRLQGNTVFAPAGQRRQAARSLVAGPGHAWVGRGVAFRHAPKRRAATLVVIWAEGQADPWVVLTDLPPGRMGVAWYQLRMWIELGFRALKGVGWQWQRTRREEPGRVSRSWLILAVATLWVVAVGTRVEDAQAQGVAPGQLQRAPAVVRVTRRLSIFRQGVSALVRQVGRGRLWRRLWLTPEPWPAPPPGIQVTVYDDP